MLACMALEDTLHNQQRQRKEIAALLETSKESSGGVRQTEVRQQNTDVSGAETPLSLNSKIHLMETFNT